ncbi:MAG: hypothetical protein ACRD5E_11080 [Nitrososphaeraceae archaeon]
MSITKGGLFAQVQIATVNGEPLYHLFSFMDEIIPLGLDLLQLHNLPNFKKFVQRLNVPSHERTSAIFEAFVAARAVRSGYSVDLEPPNGKGGFCDLKVAKASIKEVYIECKAISPHESVLKQKRQEFLQNLSNHIWEKIISYLPANRSIIIELPEDYRRRRTTEAWIDGIILALKNTEYDEWKLTDGIRFRIHFGQYTGTLRARETVVGSGSTPGWYEVLIVSAIGNASSSLKKAIREGRHQIPTKQVGAIAVQTQDFDIITKIAEDRLSSDAYRNIICIAGVNSSRGIQTFVNQRHTSIRYDFDLFS